MTAAAARVLEAVRMPQRRKLRWKGLSSLPHIAQSEAMELHSKLSRQTPEPTLSTLVRPRPPGGRHRNQELV